MLESLFNKVAHVLSYDFCGIFKNACFLIIPRNQTTLLRKQISKSNMTEIVACVFIGIFLQNIFWCWAFFFFSQSPKVVFWTNCAFPLRKYFSILKCPSCNFYKLQQNWVNSSILKFFSVSRENSSHF